MSVRTGVGTPGPTIIYTVLDQSGAGIIAAHMARSCTTMQ